MMGEELHRHAINQCGQAFRHGRQPEHCVRICVENRLVAGHDAVDPSLPALAFGGITTSSVDYRKGHAMMRYVTVNKKEFDFLRRQAYPSVRHGFRPAAYVVLTRVFMHVTEEVHG